MHTPPKLSHADLTESQKQLIAVAKQVYRARLAYVACQTHNHHPPAYIVTAPGRVNLIGEHVDYQNGFVLPLCLTDDYSVVVYGTGFLHTGKSSAVTTVRLRLVSSHLSNKNDGGEEPPEVIEESFSVDTVTPPPPPSSKEDNVGAVDDVDGANGDAAAATTPSQPNKNNWVNYVVGVIVQYLPDIPANGCVLDLSLSYASNLPMGAGLSSSAALEVATATVLEYFLHDGMAYSSVNGESVPNVVTRALRCQVAENQWAHSPCGIMDQFVVSCGQVNSLMLLDCRSLEYTQVPMKIVSDDNDDDDDVVFLITNSRVTHSIANESEYGVRRKECSDAVAALQSVPLYHVESLRDATFSDVETGRAKGKLDPILYQRAHHVVTENTRTKECCAALKLGLWDKVGTLMNASHASLRDDFQVSCPEVDVLVEIAQSLEGVVYGSRMTGGGFGGCTVSLVRSRAAQDAIAAITTKYKERTNLDCDCFVVHRPGAGARVLAIDMDCQPEPSIK